MVAYSHSRHFLSGAALRLSGRSRTRDVYGAARRHPERSSRALRYHGRSGFSRQLLSGTDLLAGATLIIPEAITYTVEPGDTLSAVASQTGVPIEELMAMNDLADTNLVIGQKLMLGGAAPAVPLSVTVEPGDSLWSLSERYGVPVSTLSWANGLAPDAMLTVGETLSIPGVQADVVPSDQGGGAEPSITIESGDSLSEIALRHGTSVEALKDLNGLDNDVLNAGATLLLPPSASRAATPNIIWPLTVPSPRISARAPCSG